ncbi:MAG: UvrD-helicase domain-containing protein [Clostridiales bacterium]|jgi:ATP-dependent helicase/nuclease subunit A|nr:UvrD-helicase domain-containing protein [Clostridiales bacterium]
MSKFQYDDDQAYAINADGNVLISASAGSGKTAVLSERYLRLLKEGVAADRILVLTFSEKAAEEMKERIGSKLKEYADTLFSEKIADARAVKTIFDGFKRANISTIHSFLHKLISRYFFELEIDPFFSIITEADADELKARAFRETVKHYAEKGDGEFDRLTYCLSGARSEDGLFQALEEYRELKAARAGNEPYDFALSEARCKSELMSGVRSEIRDYLNIARRIESGILAQNPYIEVLSDAVRDLESVLAANDDGEFLKRIEILAPNGTRISNKNADEEIERIGVFKKYYNELIRKLSRFSEELPSLIDEGRTDEELVLKFAEAEEYYDARYAEKKNADNKLDYSDLEKFAARLLESESVVSELRAEYRYLLVDEYQDTSRIQEHILNRLNGGQLFTVGDVKQSIFNFRLADPAIFAERAERYKSGEGSARNLNNNYRTSERLTDFVNRVFSRVMTRDNGGIDYARDACLAAKTEYPSEKYSPHFAAFFEKTEEKKTFTFPYSVKWDTDFFERGKGGAEGLFIASVIEEMTKTEIYIPKEKRYRTASFEDIAVIVRSRSEGAREIVRVLKSVGIPVAAEGLTDTGNAVRILAELLRVADNLKNDIPLATVMLSYFGGFSDEDLKEIRLAYPKGEYFYECFEKLLAEDDAPNANVGDNALIVPRVIDSKRADLMRRVKDFYEYILSLRRLSFDGGLFALLNEIVYGSGYDAYVGNERAAVESFIRGFADSGISLGEFAAGEGREIKAQSVEKIEGRVRVLTAHASKGLEFPIVFLADTVKKFNRMDEIAPYVFDDVLGIGFYRRDPSDMSQKNTLMRRAIIQKKDRLLREEETRLLYVAMTRAKNHLFITGTGRIKESGEECVYRKPSSFAELVRFAAFYDGEVKKSILSDALINERMCTEYGAPDPVPYDPALKERLETRLKEVTRTAAVALKGSVTSVSRRGGEGAEREKTGLFDRGNAYHRVMQYVDFDADTQGIEALKKQLVSEGILSVGEAALVKTSDISACLKSELIRKAKRGNALREKEFMLYVKGSEAYEGGGEEKMLVQGVIDLLITGEINIIADYKTGRITEERKAAYARQLGLYKKAAEAAGIRVDRICVYSFDERKTIELKVES